MNDKSKKNLRNRNRNRNKSKKNKLKGGMQILAKGVYNKSKSFGKGVYNKSKSFGKGVYNKGTRLRQIFNKTSTAGKKNIAGKPNTAINTTGLSGKPNTAINTTGLSGKPNNAVKTNAVKTNACKLNTTAGKSNNANNQNKIKAIGQLVKLLDTDFQETKYGYTYPNGRYIFLDLKEEEYVYKDVRSEKPVIQGDISNLLDKKCELFYRDQKNYYLDKPNSYKVYFKVIGTINEGDPDKFICDIDNVTIQLSKMYVYVIILKKDHFIEGKGDMMDRTFAFFERSQIEDVDQVQRILSSRNGKIEKVDTGGTHPEIRLINDFNKQCINDTVGTEEKYQGLDFILYYNKQATIDLGMDIDPETNEQLTLAKLKEIEDKPEKQETIAKTKYHKIKGKLYTGDIIYLVIDDELYHGKNKIINISNFYIGPTNFKLNKRNFVEYPVGDNDTPYSEKPDPDPPPPPPYQIHLEMFMLVPVNRQQLKVPFLLRPE